MPGKADAFHGRESFVMDSSSLTHCCLSKGRREEDTPFALDPSLALIKGSSAQSKVTGRWDQGEMGGSLEEKVKKEALYLIKL